ncbi:GTP-binding protein Rhes-like isoform X2 [Varroa jacobsoni]|uniref:GTP-binding protein Rhes n=2 Tax=Varroa TaxID=62624 RepID=A0A7M7MJY0_VARDE|nr:GTP-binding protein Rhes-like isoform X2 [Varroa destructor]XP_022710634.1 GTP-binding protein Rhes-like isoform X2 [Varroa jacobsoni]XP_022710643.1 GTP-binding protein Rhes-like isoform X2 [Varroa jacobsoni]XP_022710649.1 GTP-binding protein Rhes-like isoform X2 [Varroa jacobsoni]XP_022710657.1 GTP-binding protein Rhes-like isoform X2 [Varroa jacobsoni]
MPCMMPLDENEQRVRLVILGGPKVGKSCLLRKFLFNTFPDKYRPTVEDMFFKEFNLEHVTLKVDFLDTAGDNQFPAMRRLSIANGQAFLLVYAIDDPNSFDMLKQCFEEIREGKPDYQELPIVVCGNKSDTPELRREVSKQDVSEWLYCELPRIKTKLVECSAKDGSNVHEVFRSFIPLSGIQLLQHSEGIPTTPQLRRRSSVHLPKRFSSPKGQQPPPQLPAEPPSALQNCSAFKSKPRSRSLIRRTSKKNKAKTDNDCAVS